MEVGISQASDALCDFLFARIDLETKKPSNVGMKHASRSPRVDDGLESFRPRRAWAWKSNTDIEPHRVDVRAELVGKNAVGDFHGLLTRRAAPTRQEFLE